MLLGEEIRVFDWFRLHFIENNGMAYGIELGGEYGKLVLTLFRIFEQSSAFGTLFFSNDLHDKLCQDLSKYKFNSLTFFA